MYIMAEISVLIGERVTSAQRRYDHLLPSPPGWHANLSRSIAPYFLRQCTNNFSVTMFTHVWREELGDSVIFGRTQQSDKELLYIGRAVTVVYLFNAYVGISTPFKKLTARNG